VCGAQHRRSTSEQHRTSELIRLNHCIGFHYAGTSCDSPILSVRIKFKPENRHARQLPHDRSRGDVSVVAAMSTMREQSRNSDNKRSANKIPSRGCGRR
jgi:hypothetical protein